MASHRRTASPTPTTRAADDDAAARAAETLAPLLNLLRAAEQARNLERHARAVELFERALAAAEAALPHDSLVVASLMIKLHSAHCVAAGGLSLTTAVATDSTAARVFDETVDALYRVGGPLLGLSQRTMWLCCTRVGAPARSSRLHPWKRHIASPLICLRCGWQQGHISHWLTTHCCCGRNRARLLKPRCACTRCVARYAWFSS